MTWIAPLNERLGGLAAVSETIFAFYDRVLASRRLAPYFAGVDMRRLIHHQAQFLCSAMGGPPSHTDQQIYEAHRRLAIDDAAFDEMVAHLSATLAPLPLTEAERKTVIVAFEARRGCVTGAAEPALSSGTSPAAAGARASGR